jgi:hypothetical protein
MANRNFLTGIGRIVVGCMILGLGPVLSTAQEVQTMSPQPTEASATSGNAAGISHQVHLDAHGNLSGQIEGLNGEATGLASPVNVSFVQNGKVVATATSDGFGRFQMTGLQPGTYSVLAYGPDGVSAFSAQVLPVSSQVIPTAEGAAADSSTTLDVDVVPTADATTLAQTGEDPNASSVTAAAGTIPSDTGVPPPAGGGGGGDAGALGAALGAAAAGAGIAAGGATGAGGGGGGGAGGAAASPVSATQ